MTSGTDSEFTKHELRDALRVQLRVIGALILREFRTRFWKNRLGYLWALGEPCLHLGTWFLIRIVLFQRQAMDGMNPMLFLTTGIIPFFMFARVDSFVTESIGSNQSLLHYPLVKHIDLMIARFITESCTITVVAVIVFSTLIACGQAGIPDDPLALIPVCGALMFLGFGFGMVNSVTTILSPTYGNMLRAIRRALYFTSGIFFLPSSLPPPLLNILSYNPVFHGVELFRYSYIPGQESSFASIWYMWAWAFGLILLGLSLEKVSRKKLRE